ncbi:outer dynein arm-docking complex subunit 1-like isoform X2 [Styela clava]
MPRGKSGMSHPSEVSDADLEGFAETELEKLQRKYRIMEGDRQAYALESQDLIRRQLAEIEKLQSERSELMKDLNLAESKCNQDKDKTNISDLIKLLDEKDLCEQEIEQERETQEKLDAEIKEWEKKVKDQRINMGGNEATRCVAQQTQKRMSVLEGRLHRALSKFNTSLTKNATLRDHIETLRIEKGRFQQLHKKLDKELKDLKREIGQVIEASTLAYDQRDEAQNKILLLREKSEKDLQQFNAEIKELQRVIDHDKTLREFMMVKGITRSTEDGMLDRKGKEMKKRGDGRKSIESYENAFREIEEITGQTDIDALVAKFIQVEDNNFALFNYVNEQNNEIERLHDAIEQILKNIHGFESEGDQMESERAEILRDLEHSISVASKESEHSKKQLTNTLKILDQLKRGISSIFNKIGCDNQALSDLLGSAEGVKDDNMMQYLGLVEQRANELLAAQAYIDSQDFEKPYDAQERARMLLGQSPSTPVPPLLIAPPSTGEEYDSEEMEAMSDEESRPFTQEELKNRIMKAVLKKEAAAAKKGFRYDLSAAKKK